MEDNEILLDELSEEAEDINTTSKINFKDLNEMINTESFNKRIEKIVNRSVGEIILMILKYAIVHALSLTQIYVLFNLVNCLFDENIIPCTKYVIEKLFCSKSCKILHAICTQCKSYLGQYQRKDQFVHCSYCDLEIDVKDNSYKNFFITLDVADPILKLLEANSKYYQYVMNDRVHEKKGKIKDTCDGKKYRDFVKQLSKKDRKNYTTITFNTDGAPIFESSTQSMWPIYLMINELPMEE